MDIRQLRRFVAVVELGSFNKAAEALAVSQPSLTRSVQQLEEAVGFALFERGPGGIDLTPMGAELLPHARLILRERDQAIAAMQRLHEKSRQIIEIGAEPAFAMQALPQALQRVQDDQADIVQFRVREGSLDDLLPLLRQGDLRFVLAARPPTAELGDLRFEQLLMEKASIVMRSSHPLASAGHTDLAPFVAARWIVPDHPTLVEGWSQMFRRRNLPVPPIALQTSSVQLMRASLLAGDYVVLGNHTPFAGDVAAQRLAFIDFPQIRYERPAGLFRRQEMRLTQVETAFVDALRSVLRAPGSG